MLIINFIGIVLIILILYWFWLYTPNKQINQNDIITIYVKDGVYSPAYINIPINQKTCLRFFRQDPSPCSEVLLIEEFGIHTELPLNQNKDIFIISTKKGKFSFTCQMQMYKGILDIKDKPYKQS